MDLDHIEGRVGHRPGGDGMAAEPPKGFVDIEMEIPEKAVRHLIMAGLFREEPPGVLMLTEKGREWMDQWIDAQLKADSLP